MILNYKENQIETRISALCDSAEVKVKEIDAAGDECALLQVEVNGMKYNSVLLYRDGTIMHLHDWQGPNPENISEVEDFEWVDEGGRPAVMFDGLPRSF